MTEANSQPPVEPEVLQQAIETFRVYSGAVLLSFAKHGQGLRDTVARNFIARGMAGKLVLDWRKRQQARAEGRVTIEKLLDRGLPKAYTPELFEQKTIAVFQHIYDAYYGAGRSVYAAA